MVLILDELIQKALREISCASLLAVIGSLKKKKTFLPRIVTANGNGVFVNIKKEKMVQL